MKTCRICLETQAKFSYEFTWSLTHLMFYVGLQDPAKLELLVETSKLKGVAQKVGQFC